jgi:predicted peroxiredoxin
MRPFLIFILLTLTTSCVFGQDNVDKKKMVGFGCYYTGQPTKTVEEVTELLLKKKYKTISDLLKSGHEGEKFLATISLEKLAVLGQYELSDNEKELIKKIKTSGDKVLVCSGCTYFDKVSLKKMFSEDNFLGSSWWIEEILNPDDKTTQN